MKKIIIGSDHRGFDLKFFLIEKLNGFKWIDVGTNGKERADYPIYAKRLCLKILEGESDIGVLICGSGIGMSIAANRFPGIRAGLCWDERVAKIAKEHDNINLLVLPVDFIFFDSSIDIFNAWFNAQFCGGRYKERLLMLDSK